MEHEYDDMIEMEYPLKTFDTVKHPRMSMSDRAKIFSPFAALKGYEAAIALKQKKVVPRIELSEESKEELDEQLRKIESELQAGKHPMITVVYFKEDEDSRFEGGNYIEVTGMVAKLDPVLRSIQIVEKKLWLDDIFEIRETEAGVNKI
ncbi:MAG: hypothetical protein PHP50_13925 [Lachnospiraceae bacterium]|nr:hypothetical protein [Lachnospiraceae bacterium]